jgi:hypothetical protein
MTIENDLIASPHTKKRNECGYPVKDRVPLPGAK